MARNAWLGLGFAVVYKFYYYKCTCSLLWGGGGGGLTTYYTTGGQCMLHYHWGPLERQKNEVIRLRRLSAPPRAKKQRGSQHTGLHHTFWSQRASARAARVCPFYGQPMATQGITRTYGRVLWLEQQYDAMPAFWPNILTITYIWTCRHCRSHVQCEYLVQHQTTPRWWLELVYIGVGCPFGTHFGMVWSSATPQLPAR